MPSPAGWRSAACSTGPSGITKAAAWDSWTAWTEREREGSGSKRAFVQLVAKRYPQLDEYNRNSERGWIGLRLPAPWGPRRMRLSAISALLPVNFFTRARMAGNTTYRTYRTGGRVVSPDHPEKLARPGQASPTLSARSCPPAQVAVRPLHGDAARRGAVSAAGSPGGRSTCSAPGMRSGWASSHRMSKPCGGRTGVSGLSTIPSCLTRRIRTSPARGGFARSRLGWRGWCCVANWTNASPTVLWRSASWRGARSTTT